MAFSTNSSTSVAEMNVTPLIDVLLVLLTIFMVIGPVLPHGLESAVPKPEKSAAGAPPPVTVEILAESAGEMPRYRVGGRTVASAELRPLLQQSFSTRAAEDRTLFVQADRKLSYQRVAEVAGIGRASGAGTIALLGSMPDAR